MSHLATDAVLYQVEFTSARFERDVTGFVRVTLPKRTSSNVISIFSVQHNWPHFSKYLLLLLSIQLQYLNRTHECKFAQFSNLCLCEKLPSQKDKNSQLLLAGPVTSSYEWIYFCLTLCDLFSQCFLFLTIKNKDIENVVTEFQTWKIQLFFTHERYSCFSNMKDTVGTAVNTSIVFLCSQRLP